MREVKSRRDSWAERLDRLIGFFSPKREYARRMFRAANKFATYRGADKSRLRTDWNPRGGSADADILGDLPTLRDRSRDLNKNDGTAAGITSTMTNNTVGTGIRPQSRIDAARLGVSEEKAELIKKQAEYAFEKWTPYADSGNRMNFYQQQALVDRQILENGEALVIPLRLNDPWRPYSLALEIVEADRLQTPRDLISNKSIRSGIEIGKRGEPIAYYIRKNHPGDSTLSKNRSSSSDNFMRIPARNELGAPNVIHLYWVQRPGQSRGVPFFTPVLSLFKDMADYLEAEVVTARICACYSLFVKKMDPYGAATNAAASTNAAGQRLNELEPGMIEYLNPGEEIQSFSPEHPGGSFEPFVERMLRMIGGALGLPYELVSKDFSKTNYSSARAALLEARRYFRVKQKWIADALCQPVWDMVLEEAYLENELSVSNFYDKKFDITRAHWITPGWEWVDPLKEAKAAETALKINMTSLAAEQAAQGRDWEETMEQRSREEKKRTALELPDNLAPKASLKEETKHAVPE